MRSVQYTAATLTRARSKPFVWENWIRGRAHGIKKDAQRPEATRDRPQLRSGANRSVRATPLGSQGCLDGLLEDMMLA